MRREERDKSEWARERLKQLILESFAFEDGDHKLSIKANSIVTCDGDAKVSEQLCTRASRLLVAHMLVGDAHGQIVFSRGKKRCGYDISLKFEWVSTRLEEDAEGITDASGHIEVHDFDDMSGEDYEIRVTTEGSSKHEADAKKSIMKWETKLRTLLASWKNELLQQ